MNVVARISSEIAYLRGALRTLRRSGRVMKHPGISLRETIETVCASHGERLALESATERYTYAQWNARTNQYARWALAQGLSKGDAIGLFMPNRAEYLCVWPGLAKAGCVTALLNTNLSGQGLAHCIAIAQCRMVIVDAALLPLFESARGLLDPALHVMVFGGDSLEATEFAANLASLPSGNLVGTERCSMNIADKAIYIYTSGTTGLPKAANLNHSRLLRIMEGFSGASHASARDKIYIALPLYHSTGGVTAAGTVLTVGGACYIREKFSVSLFWSDIITQKCTMFVYVGELCRYLLHAAPGPYDKAHKLRMCFGNGLRPDIFSDFQKRFALPQIMEFYGATEGNISLFNFDSRPGSVGRIPKWAEKRYLVKIIAFDVETEKPLRGADGFCIECTPGETGEIIAQILNDPLRPTNVFDGYADKVATEKKILRDAFAKGDAWFRSGDLMKRDTAGYFYFQDRIGDTFRWKGENVSTGEVAACLTAFPGVADANVYGVAVPGNEGRAGMAALALDDAVHCDLSALAAHLAAHLPDYARPRFLRIQPHIEVTGTFKQRKVDLVQQGFDPALVPDPLYVLNGKSFVPLDATWFSLLCRNEVRL